MFDNGIHDLNPFYSTMFETIRLMYILIMIILSNIKLEVIPEVCLK